MWNVSNNKVVQFVLMILKILINVNKLIVDIFSIANALNLGYSKQEHVLIANMKYKYDIFINTL